MTPENETLSTLVADLNMVTKNIISDVSPKTENERLLCALAANCHALSQELAEILRRLKIGDRKSKWEGLVVKWHSMRKEKQIEVLERRLSGFQSQIMIRLQVIISENSKQQNRFANSQFEALRREGKALQNRTASQLDEV
ncbi:hypothetical protein BJY04DRAFT_96327 [Aspergillus karnatakaensis]|uniref:uncharacterized protein n=1 Tax=Aspergillus karnatakaensis TaxID=1810916 RepID=UPI003CCE2704